jgi:hypothetical protein
MRSKKNQDSKLISNIRPIARELMRIKKQAGALGMFTNDRELLECTGCDLVEDVTCHGFLITCHRNSNSMDDSRLRFEKLNQDIFRCPVCKTELKAKPL